MQLTEFEGILKARKSIRKYKHEAVPRDLLDRLLACATWAPSGKNRQNWHFFILTGKKRDDYLRLSQKSWDGIKEVLKTRLKPSLYEFTERFFYTLGNAPVVILCYSYNAPDEHYLTSMGSVYMAVQNLNLAAVAAGLGTCTMGAPLEIRAEVDAFLELSTHPVFKEAYLSGKFELVCGVTLGYPDHEPPKAPRQLEHRFQFLE